LKSDITRSTFKREKHHSGVRMQQGRVQLDADWNEQVDITNHRIETDTMDTVGLCGAPKGNPGFKLDIRNGNIQIGAGRFYVDGILCENEKDVAFTGQPDLPGAALPTEPGYYLAYLDVWQRHITHVEDPSLREVALHGADTATRTKTVWQLKLTEKPVQNLRPENPCETNFPEFNELKKTRRALLSARVAPAEATSSDPCLPSPASGFRGAQNQLYRIEIHQGGSEATATFKWSRDNGSVVSLVKRIDGDAITLEEPGPDDRLTFKATQWVELLDETHELGDGQGVLVRLIDTPSSTVLKFDPTTATGKIPIVTPENRLKLRRWDQKNSTEPVASAKSSRDQWFELEDGVQVQFGHQSNEYRTGDYWLIPARTATGGQIEWPIAPATKQPVAQERFGIHHHYCRLAILRLSNGGWKVEHDCRNLFSPLADRMNFFYISGDGQEALPGKKLARPLQVGVTNGERRVGGARVCFKIVAGSGQLEGEGQLKDNCFEVVTGFEGKTGPNGENLHGIAQCFWTLDNETRSQRVEARLLDAAGNEIHLPIRFNANLSRASEVAIYTVPECGENTGEPPTVQSLFRKTITIPDPQDPTKEKQIWPDLDQDGTSTVEDVLDALLCHLDAHRLPLDSRNEPPDLLCDHELFPPATTRTVGDALKALCDIKARHIGHEAPPCGEDENESASIQSLFSKGDTQVPDWPDLDKDSRVTVKDVLNGLLCHLNADRLPFQHQCPSGLYPMEMKSVGEALKALCDLAALHVSYAVPSCGSDEGEAPTVQSLLEDLLKEGWPPKDEAGRTTVKLILDALLCKLDAATLPFAPPVPCPNGIFTNGIQSVGAALEALCNLQAQHVAYQLQAHPAWQTAKDAFDFLAQEQVKPAGITSGTLGPGNSTTLVVEFSGAGFNQHRIPQVIPTTPGIRLSWSFQVEVTADQRMRYHFNITKDQTGIFGYEIRFVQFALPGS
jgi:hypothetical protein